MFHRSYKILGQHFEGKSVAAILVHKATTFTLFNASGLKQLKRITSFIYKLFQFWLQQSYMVTKWQHGG